MASFAEALYGLPTSRLRALVQNRQVDAKKLSLIPNKRQLAQFLASDLSRPASIAGAVLQCNARELRLLQLLLSGENEHLLSWKSLLELVGDPSLSNALDAVVARLEELGLAFRMQEGIFVPGAVRMQVPASLSDRYSLTKCLLAYDAPSVKRIANNLGLDANDSKNSLIAAIHDCLLGGREGVSLQKPLADDERDVLEYLVQVGGSASAVDVVSANLGGRMDDFFRYDWQNRWKQGHERNAIDRLLARGLLFVTSHGYAYNLILVIPGDLLRALTGGEDTAFWTGEPPAPSPLAAPPVAVTRHTSLIRDVVALLGFLGTQEAVRTNTGHIHKTSLKNLARALSLPDERYAAFLYALCREAKLIAVEGERQVYSLTSRGNSWLFWEPVAQVRTLFQGWRDGTLWAEMINDPLHKQGEYRPEASILPIRSTMLSIVTDSPSEAFLELESLAETLTFRTPLVLARSTAIGADLVPSPLVFARRLVTECLYWLGMAELGWKAPPPPLETAALAKPRLSASALAAAARGEAEETVAAPEAIGYRLTTMGAHLLGVPGAEPPTAEPTEDSFIVQANAEIFVPPYLAPTTFYRLLVLTEPPAKGAAGNTVSLTREAIRRALDRGETTRDILAFLQAHTRTGIPQNVEYLINEVGGKHGHIHIGRAQFYLQVDTPLLLQELQARRELKPYFVRALSDTVAILSSDDPEKLLRELRKAGYLPVSDDNPRKKPFSAQPRLAPPDPDIPPADVKQAARRAAKANSALDWDRIALEDRPE